MSDDFFLHGFNPDGTLDNAGAVVKGLALICGQESLTLSSPNNEVFNIFISSPSAEQKKYSLAEIWKATHPNSYVDSNIICGIDYFKICSTIWCSKDDKITHLNISNSELTIDISKSLSLNEFYITPVTKGGITDPQLVKLHICGNEIIYKS